MHLARQQSAWKLRGRHTLAPLVGPAVLPLWALLAWAAASPAAAVAASPWRKSQAPVRVESALFKPDSVELRVSFPEAARNVVWEVRGVDGLELVGSTVTLRRAQVARAERLSMVVRFAQRPPYTSNLAMRVSAQFASGAVRWHVASLSVPPGETEALGSGVTGNQRPGPSTAAAAPSQREKAGELVEIDGRRVRLLPAEGR